jgi:hypothetical protein
VREALLVALLAATTCQRCGRSPSQPDAGRAHRASTDVRTALFTVFPEFRFARVVAGEAKVTRTLAWKVESNEALRAALTEGWKEKGFVETTDGGALAVRAPFLLSAERAGDTVALTMTLPIGPDDVGKLLKSPAPVTTDHLLSYLPTVPGAPVRSEEFQLSLEYQAEPAHADILTRQLVDLLQASGWKVDNLPEGWEPGRRPDGGLGGVPREFELTLTQGNAEVRVMRSPAQVKVALHQVL